MKISISATIPRHLHPVALGLARMQRFIHQPALIERWGKVSRRRARRWTPEAGAAKWIEAFQTVLDR